jgi:hypothetical protein
MKKFSKKGVLLFAGAMAVCAFVLPSIASAASWGPINSHHVLHSPNLGFTNTGAVGNLTSQCTNSTFTADVVSAGDLSITASSFGGACTTSGPSLGDCTTTATGSRFPWRATAVTTSNIQLHNVFIDVRFENMPGLGNSCAINGATLTITGTLTGGNWTGNAVHALDLNNAEGLVSHSALGNGTPITTRALLVDTGATAGGTGTLTVS